MREASVGALSVGRHDFVAVVVVADEAHVDEGGVDDELIVVNLWAGDDSPESFDKQLAMRSISAISAISAGHHVEVGCATLHVLAALRVVGDEVVQGFAAVAAGDDDGQAQCLAKRFERVDAEQAQVLDSLRRGIVLDALLLGRLTADELAQLEVRGELNVVHFFKFNRLIA